MKQGHREEKRRWGQGRSLNRKREICWESSQVSKFSSEGRQELRVISNRPGCPYVVPRKKWSPEQLTYRSYTQLMAELELKPGSAASFHGIYLIEINKKMKELACSCFDEFPFWWSLLAVLEWEKGYRIRNENPPSEKVENSGNVAGFSVIFRSPSPCTIFYFSLLARILGC